MIFDNVANANLYTALDARIARGLEFLKKTDLASLPPGRHEIDADRVYASISEYSTRPLTEGRWEAHRRYIDLQYLVRGTERVGHAPIDGMHAGPYDKEKDLTLLEGSGEFVTLRPGDLMILWPHEAHMPGIAVDGPVPVRKIVVKIAMQS